VVVAEHGVDDSLLAHKPLFFFSPLAERLKKQEQKASQSCITS
jgi:hypothetical protein